MAPPSGWTVGTCGCGKKCWDGYSTAIQTKAQASAAYIMWAATGRQFGLYELTVMPPGLAVGAGDPDTEYRVYPVTMWGNDLIAPAIENGQWYNRPRGTCCPGACEVALQGPTATSQIISVHVGGDLVDPDAYAIQDAYLLVRVDGGCWPCCNNYGHPDTAFTVNYTIGTPIPAAVQTAFERLACEIAKDCAGNACALPRNITRLTRQGVDLEVQEIPTDPGGLILTGLWDVDQIIRAVNPNQLTRPPMVLSPDMPPPRRFTP